MRYLIFLALFGLAATASAQPPTLTVEINGAGPISGSYTVNYLIQNAGDASRFGQVWLVRVAIPIPGGSGIATQIRAAYGGAAFPGTLFVSVYDSGGMLVAQFSGSAPPDASMWNQTLPGLVAGTANVRP